MPIPDYGTLTGLPVAIETLLAFGFVSVFVLYCITTSEKES